MSESDKRKPKGKKKKNGTASSSQPLPNVEDAFSAAITIVAQDQKEALRRLWDTAYELGRKHGIEEGRGKLKQPVKPKPKRTPAAHRIPQELFDYIIDFAHDDKELLSTCALVCHSWLLSARIHLFSSVELRLSFVDTVNPFDRVNTGISIVTGSRRIASLVRSLDIDSYEDLMLPKALEFLSKLTNLNTLSLSNIQWPECHHSISRWTYIAFSAVQSTLECIYMDNCDFVDLGDLAAFIECFPKLQILSMHRVLWEGDWKYDVPPPTPIFRMLPSSPSIATLKEFAFTLCTSPQILHVIMSSGAFKLALDDTRICWDNVLNQHLDVYSRYFNLIGPTLKEIGVDIQVDNNEDAFYITDILSKCRRLESFSIDILFNDVGRSDALYQWFVPLLESLQASCSTHLREIIIQCFLQADFRRNQFLPWKAMDDILSDRGRFSHLGMLHIVVNGVMGGVSQKQEKEVCQNLERALPKLFAAKMLDVRPPSSTLFEVE